MVYFRLRFFFFWRACCLLHTYLVLEDNPGYFLIDAGTIKLTPPSPWIEIPAHGSLEPAGGMMGCYGVTATTGAMILPYRL